MFRLVLIGGTLLALASSAGANETVLSPPASIDRIDIALMGEASQRQLPLPPISRTSCDNAGYANCRYRVGHAMEIEASGAKTDGPAATIRARMIDERDRQTYVLLVDLFMTRFDSLPTDRRADLVEQAAADLNAGKNQTKLEGERTLVTLDRLHGGEMWITVEGR